MIEVPSDRFHELAEAAYHAIPAEFTDLLDNVALFVEDDPPPADPYLLGLYDGVAQTLRGGTYAGVLPDRIIVYRRPTLAICETEQQVIDQVRITVLHEVAHHFGIDDARLDELGYA